MSEVYFRVTYKVGEQKYTDVVSTTKPALLLQQLISYLNDIWGSTEVYVQTIRTCGCPKVVNLDQF